MRDTIFEHPDLPDDPFYPSVPLPVSIELRYQMAFYMPCNHEGVHAEHPEKVTFAKGAVLGGDRYSDGDVVVSEVYAGHQFRFTSGEYRVV